MIKHMGNKSKSSTKAEAAVKDRKEALKNKVSTTTLKSEAMSETDSSDSIAKAEDPKVTQAKGGSRLGSMFAFSYSSSGKKTSPDAQDNVEAADENTTAEAMEGSRGESDGSTEPELAELCICVHGIGQKLATTYESFSIVHAINALRKLCNKQARDPAITDIVGSKRIQFMSALIVCSEAIADACADRSNGAAHSNSRR